MIEIRWRYWIYGALILSLTAAYFTLNENENSSGDGVTQRDRNPVELPPLNALNASGRTEVKRNLFALPARVAPVVATVEQKKKPPPPPPVDRLAKIEVIGFVRQNGQRSILVKTGNEVTTIAVGQRFGKDEALEIDMVEAGQIRVSDHIANVSKTFTLSEE
jgi:uncharacterized lipoprotein